MKLKKSSILNSSYLTAFLFLLLNTNVSASLKPSQKETDSLNYLISDCKGDSCKFYVLHSIFWKYRLAGNPISKRYGEWAFSLGKSSENLRVLADAYDIKANLLNDENKFDSSFVLFAKALDCAKKIDFKFRIMWCYYNIGRIYAINFDNERALRFYKLARDYSIYINSIDQTSWFNTCIARTYEILSKKDSAELFYDYNISIFKKFKDKDGEIYNYLDIYFFYLENNNFKKAYESIYLSLVRAEALNKPEPLFYVYMNMGLLFFNKDNDSVALIYYNKALPLAQQLKRIDLVAELNTLYSKYYVRNGQYKKALVYLNKCLNLKKRISDKCILSEIYYFLGVTYEKLGNCKSALESFKLCYSLGSTSCDRTFYHRILISMGDINLKKSDTKEALHWYSKSLELADSCKSKEDIAISKLRLGNYYNSINRLKTAETIYLESFKSANECENISIIKDIADTLSNYYYLIRNYRLSNNYLKISEKMKDSIRSSEQLSGISKLEMMIELEKNRRMNEMKVLKASEEVKHQKLQRNYFAAFSFLLCIAVIITIKSYRRKKKDNILLYKSNQQINEQKKELEEVSKKLHEADELKLRFFTNISHELRTPLTLIISPVTKLLKDEKGDNEIYSLVLKSARKLQELINQLLDISRIDKGELKLTLKQHNFSRQINAIVSMFQSLIEEKKIKFRITEVNKNIIFSYDSDRIEHVINNLLSNALKFSKPGGSVSLKISLIGSTENSDKLVQVKVKDNGIGIPESSIKRIFDRFYQCENSTGCNYGGSGIGLSLTKEIVELHGGTILVQSVQNKWTEFTVLLPFIMSGNCDEFEDNKIGNSFANKALIPDHNFKNRNGAETILVVEDNKDLTQYLKQSLSQYFNVITAGDGEEGFEAAVNNIPDIIISDVMMPMMNGYEFVSTLKKNVSTCHIPVILLTAKAERKSRIEGFESGAYDYINKPFDEEELILKIRNIAQNKKLLQEKYRKQITVSPSKTDSKSLDEQFLINLTIIIEEEISSTELNGEYISRKIGLSRPQVYRKLMALTDMSINQFIRSIRLKRAADILKNKSATVSEAAFMTGFESLSYFTKKFREEFGKLPSEF